MFLMPGIWQQLFFYTHYCEFINSVFDLDAIADHELELFNTMLMDQVKNGRLGT